MRLSFHSFGRKRFIEGSSVALHKKGLISTAHKQLNMSAKAVRRKKWTYERATMPRMKK